MVEPFSRLSSAMIFICWLLMMNLFNNLFNYDFMVLTAMRMRIIIMYFFYNLFNYDFMAAMMTSVIIVMYFFYNFFNDNFIFVSIISSMIFIMYLLNNDFFMMLSRIMIRLTCINANFTAHFLFKIKL